MFIITRPVQVLKHYVGPNRALHLLLRLVVIVCRLLDLNAISILKN